MSGWNRRSGQKFWVAPEQVAAHRAGVAFVEWWKVIMEGPLHRAGHVPTDLSLAAAEMLMCLADARVQGDPVERVRRFRASRQNAIRCDALLDTPEALELASGEELGRGHRLLGRFLELLDRLIRPPPDGPQARTPA